MINRRPYIAEGAIKPGTAVVQGSADNKVKAPGEDGSGDFIGVYPWEANEAKAAGDPVGIALHGVVKALAGGNVVAGKKAVLKADASGSFVEASAAAGQHDTVGLFLEGGSAGEYVDLLVERGSITVAESEEEV
jgi:hypothetical protein